MLEKLKKAKITAMREKNSIAKKILSLLHSDALNTAKKEMREVTDEDVVKTAKSLIKKNKKAMEETKEKIGVSIPQFEKENVILLNFLPKQLSEAAVKAAIDVLIEKIPEDERTKKARGGIMKTLNREFGNTIDMGSASKYVSTKLN